MVRNPSTKILNDFKIKNLEVLFGENGWEFKGGIELIFGSGFIESCIKG